ncbi:MAG: sorbosone dehydrogenase family protein [Chitinophagaceae bacterium]|nr:sorbosone dehydrogenase family protein [Chitinophagaceae bacterium]
MEKFSLRTLPLLNLGILIFCACGNGKISKNPEVLGGSATTSGYTMDSLAAPFATPSAKNFSKIIGWSEGKTPTAPQGFSVTKFADGLDHPRWIYVAENGDIFVTESNTILKGIVKIGSKLSRKIKTQGYGVSANRITLFRDADKNGIPENRFVFMEGLKQPFGMLILGNYFYVANTNALLQIPYTTGSTGLSVLNSKKIVSLPDGGGKLKKNIHWTRNIIANTTRDKIYIAVGAGSNVAEHGLENEIRRANILEINPDGTGERIYAAGLRNPVGMDWAPGTKTLWTAVNERDLLGDELVPDYMTAVKKDGFYGWPFAYFGQNEDPRWKEKQQAHMVQKTLVPDIALGSHTASLGLAFYTHKSFPSKYHQGAFIGQHGSWNRSVLSGYKVVFVPFSNGKPSGPPEDFLTGFIKDLSKEEVHGRPVCVAFLADGSMLVTDDVSNTIWRVSANK